MNKHSSALIGAAFLMATSAIGPGFLTQTTVFTAQLLSSFGFVILISIVLDMGAQLNIWRIVTISGKPAQTLANELLPGLGYFLASLIVLGGWIFNIGNIAGCGLGLQVLFGLNEKWGAGLSAIAAIGLFVVKDAKIIMDRFAQLLGFLMVGLTCYIAFTSHPPLTDALMHSFFPEEVSMLAIVTIVGGTVGGYITFAGAHRLLDEDIKGVDHINVVNRSAATAIGVASLMRIFLFLAALGVVTQFTPAALSKWNPAASVFQLATGQIGLKIFGLVLWCAAITSVVGASYTSVSFVKTFHPLIETKQTIITLFFIVSAAIFFLLFGKPVPILIFAGAFNGVILAISLGITLLTAHFSKNTAYKHPNWLFLWGWLVVLIMSILGSQVLWNDMKKIF
jgi:Mn2+/Fe2+ NRAMP family transporter